MATEEEGVAAFTQPQQDSPLSRGKGGKSSQRGTQSELGPIPLGQALKSVPSHLTLLPGISFISLPFQWS